MLANEGYTVMEIGYNLPEQDNIFTSTSPMKLEYFENAIRQLLAHPKSYGDRVCVIGQCKGGDIAHALVRVRTFYRKLFISKICLFPWIFLNNVIFSIVFRITIGNG